MHFANQFSSQDVAMCTNMNVKLVFLPAADIPNYVSEGK